MRYIATAYMEPQIIRECRALINVAQDADDDFVRNEARKMLEMLLDRRCSVILARERLIDLRAMLRKFR